MKRKKDYLAVVISNGILMVLLGFVLGLLVILINGVLSMSLPVVGQPETAHAAVFDFKKEKKHKITNLNISDTPQKVKVLEVADDNTFVVKGEYTNPKRLALYLTVLPSSELFAGESAHNYFKKLMLHKTVYVFNDDQTPKKKNELVYVKIGNQLVQSKLLRKGYAAIYNYNGSEEYYQKFVKDQDYGQQHSNGVWIRPGYVTENGFDRKIGKE